ncbi:MAG: cadmium transporter [Bifidobacterium sp.]|nr:cadmium transporter [Bifidobacterium sp.]
MTDKATSVARDRHTGVPVMLAQAIVLAAALALGELICCPLYVRFAPVFYPLSWALVAILLAVAFAFVVGFALLWCAEAFAYRMRRKFQPIVYAVTGAVGFGVWTWWVVLGIMNMITGRLGLGVVNPTNTVMATAIGAILGMAAFFLAFTLGERLARHKAAMVAVCVLTVLLAIAGGFILAAMLGSLPA